MKTLTQRKVPSKSDLRILQKKILFTPTKDLYWKEAARVNDETYHLTSARLTLVEIEDVLAGRIELKDIEQAYCINQLMIKAQRHLLLFSHYENQRNGIN